MSLEELDKLERQRRDADQRYNDALTAFDAALVHAAPPATAGLVADSALPPVPDGWRGWSVRAVQQWLSPWIDRQHAFNARAADAIEALVARDRERTTAFERFQAALIAFLQQEHPTALPRARAESLRADTPEARPGARQGAAPAMRAKSRQRG